MGGSRRKMIAKEMGAVSAALPSLGRNNKALELTARKVTGTDESISSTIKVGHGRRGNSASCYRALLEVTKATDTIRMKSKWILGKRLPELFGRGQSPRSSILADRDRRPLLYREAQCAIQNGSVRQRYPIVQNEACCGMSSCALPPAQGGESERK